MAVEKKLAVEKKMAVEKPPTVHEIVHDFCRDFEPCFRLLKGSRLKFNMQLQSSGFIIVAKNILLVLIDLSYSQGYES